MNKLFDLCKHVAVSGHEFEFSKYLLNIFDEFCDETQTDVLGNVIGVINKGAPKRIMIEAHMDEIGLMVKNIDENGFIRFVSVGGFDPAVLPATEVYIHGNETIFGVIGAKPPHLQTQEEAKNNYELEDLYIDTGYSFDEVSKIVSIGDVISFKSTPKTLKNDYFSSKTLDNRLGVYVVLECLKRLKEKKINAEVIGLCAVQEEVGCRGAKVGAYTISPDYAFVVDVTHGRSPYVNECEGFLLKGGVAVGVGPNLNNKLTKEFIKTAEENNISYTIEVCSGNSGTDAWPIQISRKGIPCILASVPIRYMHSSIETANWHDVDCTINAICSMIERE